MTTPHKATNQQWATVEEGANGEMGDRAWNAAACLLEIRDRLAALEAKVGDQPEPQGLTDEELLRFYGVATPCYHVEEYKRELDLVRAAIAADRARWGRPTTEPVPIQPDGRQGLTWISVAKGLRCILQDDSEDAIQRVWQRSRILDAVDLIEANCLPISVTERLPGPGDCDAEGRCWWWCTDGPTPGWILYTEAEGWTRWLPHYALPMPPSEEVQ